MSFSGRKKFSWETNGVFGGERKRNLRVEFWGNWCGRWWRTSKRCLRVSESWHVLYFDFELGPGLKPNVVEKVIKWDPRKHFG